jgi:hypothetical protein
MEPHPGMASKVMVVVVVLSQCVVKGGNMMATHSLTRILTVGTYIQMVPHHVVEWAVMEWALVECLLAATGLGGHMVVMATVV